MGNVFCYSAETLEKVMPIRTLSMIALTVYFDWIKEKAVWNGENVQLKASFQNIISSIYRAYQNARENASVKT